jgi:hypothetical protein
MTGDTPGPSNAPRGHEQPPAEKRKGTTEPVPPFVGRSRGVIQISDGALLAPVNADWEAGEDL